MTAYTMLQTAAATTRVWSVFQGGVAPSFRSFAVNELVPVGGDGCPNGHKPSSGNGFGDGCPPRRGYGYNIDNSQED